jgi:predicted DNA-binding transcriptional regulator AlpA
MSEEKNKNSLFLTITQAAEKIGINAVTLYRHCEQGTFPSQKICGRRLISRAYLESLAANPASVQAEV